MADTKISALTASTTPLAGTEVLPIVQSGVTKQVSVANLTAGRAISATQLTLTTGNLIVANGQGIDFSATPGTGTSELLADYEEGTWTPTLATLGDQFTSVTYDPGVGGRYVRVGNVVHVQGYMRTDAVTVGCATSIVIIAGLPFTAVASSGSTSNGQSAVSIAGSESWLVNNPSSGRVNSNTNYILLYYKTTANGDSSTLPVAAVATGADSNIINFSATYVCA
jgi:hypothetical protein